MIVKKTTLNADRIDINDCLELKGDKYIFSNSIYIDLEHFIYKIPICVGVLGICTYNSSDNTVMVEQYMIQNKEDAKDILYITKNLLEHSDKKYVITFAGENDFSVINFLFRKNRISNSWKNKYQFIDLQKKYLEDTGDIIGLKNLEKVFNIERNGAIVSGSGLAKTFKRILKEPGYGQRMSQEKIDRILNYNLQDVVNLFRITTNWNKYIAKS